MTGVTGWRASSKSASAATTAAAATTTAATSSSDSTSIEDASLHTIVLHLAPTLDSSLVAAVLAPLLGDASIVKVVHNVHDAAYALDGGSRTQLRPANCVDLQLAYEQLVDVRVRNADLECIASHGAVAIDKATYKEKVTNQLERDARAWTHDNLAGVLLRGLRAKTRVLLGCYSKMVLQDAASNAAVAMNDKLVARMTARRWRNAVVNRGVPSIWFDRSNDFAVRSLECLEELQRGLSSGDGGEGDDDRDGAQEEASRSIMSAPNLQCDLEPLLALLPDKYRAPIQAIDGFRDTLVDICLDIGRTPHVYVGKGQRISLATASVPSAVSAASATVAGAVSAETNGGGGDGSLATNGMVLKADIDEILANLGGAHKIGFDNRAGIDRQLHRISVMRDKTGNEVYGLTMRVGRALLHAANVLQDVLMSARHRDKSVLLLGRPGCGKTTLIRDIARSVAATRENVCIIDTSNEIGGDGLVPHACVGWARRMMVPSLEQQASVMIECVQNHTVETLIIDEIGRRAEVLAAATVRQRGPRIVASGHGDLRSLIKNPDLKGLVGGVQQVTVGDAAAAKSPHGSKVQTERAGAPVFDIIVELDHVDRGRCQIVWDVGAAVDAVLRGEDYACEVRKQDLSARGILSL